MVAVDYTAFLMCGKDASTMMSLLGWARSSKVVSVRLRDQEPRDPVQILDEILGLCKCASCEWLTRPVEFGVMPQLKATTDKLVNAVGVHKESMKFLKGGFCEFDPSQAKKQEVNENGITDLYFSYEVEWKQSSIRWASRWDTYLAVTNVQVHWFSIVNSVAVVFFLSGMLTMVIVPTLRRDIARYNKDEESEDAMEETGWKLVHGDVFRPSQYPKLFVAVVGRGIQVFFLMFITIVFAVLGMLSPASRGALMTAAIFLYVFMGLFAGYFSARLYKTLWRKAAFLVPFATMVALLCLRFGISVPLVFLGYFLGYRKKPYEHPVRTNQILRQVPEQLVITEFIPTLLYFGYTCIMVLTFWLLTGTIGFHATYFLCKIYAAVKIERAARFTCLARRQCCAAAATGGIVTSLPFTRINFFCRALTLESECLYCELQGQMRHKLGT
ncbi:transmembrane 9 superfamily member 4 [Rhipicephalus sanguineus]|uniref:transmembrane 9 superfamily member 4 n=1 Tax=Rhipicephalus sanguineus TaxID=34632 RepID=UPI0020C2992A|nr:transmembrane 9 superfamily member 4 [Rhipicephalus sanguineus]